MIVRDEQGIIVQHPTMDGGDSCARTGIMALVDPQDQKNLRLFVVNNKIVRHPYQPKDHYNDPSETSRDNIVQYFVSTQFNALAAFYADQWFINQDFLSPMVKLYLYRVSGFDAPAWLELLGNIELRLAMWWNTQVKPKGEMNMFACVCLRLEKVKELVERHPDLYKNIMVYYSGWRDQPEIGEAFISRLKEAAK